MLTCMRAYLEHADAHCGHHQHCRVPRQSTKSCVGTQGCLPCANQAIQQGQHMHSHASTNTHPQVHAHKHACTHARTHAHAHTHTRTLHTCNLCVCARVRLMRVPTALRSRRASSQARVGRQPQVSSQSKTVTHTRACAHLGEHAVQDMAQGGGDGHIRGVVHGLVLHHLQAWEHVHTRRDHERAPLWRPCCTACRYQHGTRLIMQELAGTTGVFALPVCSSMPQVPHPNILAHHEAKAFSCMSDGRVSGSCSQTQVEPPTPATLQRITCVCVCPLFK